MKVRFLSLSFLALLLLTACSENPTPEEQAMRTAKAYYDDLLAGRYDRFLMGRAGTEGIPEGYREQLMDSYKQFMAEQREKHGGIRSVAVNNAVVDSAQHLIQVFLILRFGDATQEEIVVPMVEKNGEWKIK